MSSTENSEREKNLVANYVGTHPYSFSSSQRVHKYYPGLSQNNIHKKLSKVDVYSLFRKKKRSKANPIYVYYPRQLFQADSIYFTDPKFKRVNKGFKYLLVIIDCYTKFVWAQPLKSLKCKGAIEIFRDVFSKISPPKNLQTDQGAEFKCGPMKTFLKEQNVFHYFSYGDRKSAIVERVNRSLQNIIYPLMRQKKHNVWIKLLDEALLIYNSRHHRTIRMSPIEAEQDSNKDKLVKIYREKYNSVKKQRPKFKLGDLVRLQMKNKGGIKRREYLQTFTDEKYKIVKVINYLPKPMYKVSRLSNGEILSGGSFYGWELSRAS